MYYIKVNELSSHCFKLIILYYTHIHSDALLSEYAYVLQPNGRLFTVTDVAELHK